ncbi:MAG TPA: lytic transglycosylase domain-containing protein [Bryobacteraceae bacterium]|nr:lytic transglycosylase domain-containing protein [Bryobacteraceae bacterium]
MRKCLAVGLLAGVCLLAEAPKPESLQPAEQKLKVLTLRNGQKIVYDDISRDGASYFVRAGGHSLIVDAADVIPEAAVGGSSAVIPSVPGVAARLIGPYAGKHNLRPELIQAVMEVESGYQVHARSPVGAIGLMQLMPQTARHLNVNAHDPEQNVEGGARLLDILVKKYEGRRDGLALALAAYNAGSGAVDRFGGIPPYKETRQYVVKVIRRFRELVKE